METKEEKIIDDIRKKTWSVDVNFGEEANESISSLKKSLSKALKHLSGNHKK
jgi:hypothetical protein